ncbi:hypothetical protein ZIOFF_045096 [Zingiber officinale]|uniref:Cystatin domain-containing protein n=1 Tax=Zingiber officinale TaxID=94328 RepID=A0A8J5G0C7_ZINOF|nr:hypothetical protein ZIOFF_045096 [Zingiber officinale]
MPSTSTTRNRSCTPPNYCFLSLPKLGLFLQTNVFRSVDVQNALLEFARVVKAREQVVAGTLHHLTVEAVEGGEKKLYEPKVWEPSLHAAVMLEQASYCYLLSIPPMLHKYGFHLVLFGNRYYISDQRQHAIRAYRNALFVYRENGWSYISDHVHYNVGSLQISSTPELKLMKCGSSGLNAC